MTHSCALRLLTRATSASCVVSCPFFPGESLPIFVGAVMPMCVTNEGLPVLTPSYHHLLLLLLLCLTIPQEVEQLCQFLDFGGPAMVKCSKVHTLPTIAFTIGGKEFSLTPEQYILKIDAGRVLSTRTCVRVS